jgi:hypothetical protein
MNLEIISKIEPRYKDFLKISVKQFQNELQTSKGAKIVTLVTVTVPPMIIKDNPFVNKCVKISRVNGIVNWHYGNAVNRQLNKEGKKQNFIPQERKWGTRLNNSPFVVHIKDGETKLYLEVKVEKSLGYIYFDTETKSLIPISEILSFLKEKNSAKEFQGVEKEIILRDYNVRNILCIYINQQGYIIDENQERKDDS